MAARTRVTSRIFDDAIARERAHGITSWPRQGEVDSAFVIR